MREGSEGLVLACEREKERDIEKNGDRESI